MLVTGVVVALGAHLGCRITERGARRAYKELVGEEAAADAPNDVWKDVRPLVGRWGILLATLEFLRGLGVVVAVGAGLYMVAAR
jgi:hypothetical protein